LLNRIQYPSDVIALVVLWRLRSRLTLQDDVDNVANGNQGPIVDGDKMKLFLKVLADRLGDLLRAVLLAAVAPSRQANRFDEGRGISVHWQVIRSDDAARQHKPAELRANATHGLRFRW
jgi:hypothetical protein